MKKTLALPWALCLTLALALALLLPDSPAARAGQGASGSAGALESYAARVSATIKRNFRIPPAWRALDYAATVRVDIDRSGRVRGASITRPSGHPAFDAAVLAAIRRTGDFGPPPFELYAVGLRFSSRM